MCGFGEREKKRERWSEGRVRGGEERKGKKREGGGERERERERDV